MIANDATISECRAHLGRSWEAVYAKAKSEGIAVKTKRKWQEHEYELLHNTLDMRIKKIANILGRTPRAVGRKRELLGLKVRRRNEMVRTEG